MDPDGKEVYTRRVQQPLAGAEYTPRWGAINQDPLQHREEPRQKGMQLKRLQEIMF